MCVTRLLLVLGCIFAPKFLGPRVAGPVVAVRAVYPGANAETMVDTVAAPIEQQVNGVERTRWLCSRSENNGQYCLRVAFAEGTDPQQARKLVQDRVALALPMLPDATVHAGTTVSFDAPPVMILALDSNLHSLHDLGNLASLKVVKQLQQMPSVGRVELIPKTEMAVHVYVDPDRLSSRALTIADVTSRLKGELEDQPKDGDADLDGLEKIVLKTASDGKVIRLLDVARVELGGGEMRSFARFDGKRVVAVVIRPAVGVLTVAEDAELRRQVTTIRSQLPEGVDLNEFFACDRRGAGKGRAGDYWSLDAAFPTGASVERIEQSLSRFEAEIRRVPGLKSVLTVSEDPFVAFRAGPSILLRFNDAVGREPDGVRREIRAVARGVQDFVIHIRHLSPQSGDEQALDMAIIGAETDKLRPFADALLQRLRKSEDFGDASHQALVEAPSLRYDVDRERIATLGVSISAVVKLIEALQRQYASRRTPEIRAAVAGRS